MNISDAAFRLETQIALSEDEVHLWRIELATVAKGEQRWEQILSKDERAGGAVSLSPGSAILQGYPCIVADDLRQLC